MACVSKNTSIHLQLYPENHQLPTSCANSSNCFSKEPVSSEIHTVHTVYPYGLALFERGFYFLITVNGRPSIREGLLFEGGASIRACTVFPISSAATVLDQSSVQCVRDTRARNVGVS